jgi:hypothetical protein
VACCAIIAVNPTTPATLTVAIVVLAVAIRRMPLARVVITASYAVIGCRVGYRYIAFTMNR